MAKTKSQAAAPPEPCPICEMRVTFKGDGRISNGKQVPGLGDEFYEEGETFSIASDIGYALQDRGLAEFKGKKPPRPAAPAEPDEAEPEEPDLA